MLGSASHEWAGHSVEMLLRVYARCVAGMEDIWIERMDASLRPPQEGQARQETEQVIDSEETQ